MDSLKSIWAAAWQLIQFVRRHPLFPAIGVLVTLASLIVGFPEYLKEVEAIAKRPEARVYTYAASALLVGLGFVVAAVFLRAEITQSEQARALAEDKATNAHRTRDEAFVKRLVAAGQCVTRLDQISKLDAVVDEMTIVWVEVQGLISGTPPPEGAMMRGGNANMLLNQVDVMERLVPFFISAGENEANITRRMQFVEYANHVAEHETWFPAGVATRYREISYRRSLVFSRVPEVRSNLLRKWRDAYATLAAPGA